MDKKNKKMKCDIEGNLNQAHSNRDEAAKKFLIGLDVTVFSSFHGSPAPQIRRVSSHNAGENLPNLLLLSLSDNGCLFYSSLIVETLS